MAPLRPTKREVFIVVAFLIVVALTGGHNSVRRASWVTTRTPYTTISEQKLHDTSLDNPRLEWKSGEIPETLLVQHAPGWSIFDNLYMLNGTLFVVTTKREVWPDRSALISTGYPLYNGDEEIRKRIPTDKEIQIISPARAAFLFGHAASRLDGVTFLANDPSQFIQHYYHFCAELIWAAWRTYSSLDLSITASGQTTLPPPRRLLFPHLSNYRDKPGANAAVVRGAFPSASIEFEDAWHDRAKMGVPFVFDRVLIADRAAAQNGTHHDPIGRPAVEAFSLLPGSVNWWLPVRNAVLDLAGLTREESQREDVVVITYISRQKKERNGRMLKQEDHEVLVEELIKLRDRYGYEVNVVNMEKLSILEQFHLAGRTTIMMGTHGNGLTHALWMNAKNPLATVMEFVMPPEGWSYDYSYTAHMQGLNYFVFRYNESAPFSPTNRVYQPPGFHGPDIPIDGKAVARLCQQLITGSTQY